MFLGPKTGQKIQSKNGVFGHPTSDNTVVNTVTVGGSLWGVAITHDGAFVYMTAHSSNNVSVIRTSDNTVVTTVGVGINPAGVAITPDGAFAYVANIGSNSVSVIRTSDNTMVATVPVETNPWGIAITPNGAFAYVANNGSNSVSVIRTSDNAVVATVPVGTGPWWVAIEPAPRVITVPIDVKPGSFPNSINPRSNGVIPVAILTTVTFDAATADSTTIHFGATGTEAAPMHVAMEDVDGDGDTDMILHFKTQEVVIACGVTSASLTGKTLSGQAIEGSDSVRTVGCK